MRKEYSYDLLLIYRESELLLLFSGMGIGKVRYNTKCSVLVFSDINTLCVRGSVFKKYRTAIARTYFLNFLGPCVTSLTQGFFVKTVAKGKRTRFFYDNSLFFFKLGYQKRVPYVLPFNVTSSPKKKTKSYLSVRGLQHNLVSSSAYQLSSFRLVDPYNFGGLVFRNSFFSYQSWNSKL